MRRYAIYAAVCAAMLGSICALGFFGPLVVMLLIELLTKKYELRVKK